MKTKTTILAVVIMALCSLLVAPRAVAQEIQVVTTARTNLDAKKRSVHTTNTFTRDGKTNLVIRTLTKEKSLRIRIQRIYYEGILLGEIDDDKANGVFGISTERNRPYDLNFQFNTDKSLQSVSISTNGIILDEFECTNGVLYPVESVKIKEANDLGVGIKELLDPKNLKVKTPAEF